MGNQRVGLAGWVLTILGQVVAALALVFLLLSVVWRGEPAVTLGQFLLLVFSMWFGFVVGVYGAGLAILRRRQAIDLQARARLISTAGAALIPFLALFILGATVTPGNQVDFQRVVMETWQPILASLGLVLAVVGFYVPSWLRHPRPSGRKEPVSP